MAEDRMKILEERLTRLEAALTQRHTTGTGGGGFTPPGGVITDPRTLGRRPWQFIPGSVARLSIQLRGRGREAGARPRWPTPVVDPGPFPMPVVDPAPGPVPSSIQRSFAQASLPLHSDASDHRRRSTATRLQQIVSSTTRSHDPQHQRRKSASRCDGTMVKKQIDALKKQQPG